VKPVPLTAAALILTAAVPVELSVSVCVVAVFTESLPNVRLVALTFKVGIDEPSCRTKVFDAPPALAVKVTAAPELTEDTVAVKLAVVELAGTVTDVGTVTAVSLLARLTANPPVAAAAFRVTVQLSVPAPVIDPLVQVSPVSTGTPVPLRLIAVEVLPDELLVSVRVPEAGPAAVGSNCTVNVAV
jgi:hypothetical protein